MHNDEFHNLCTHTDGRSLHFVCPSVSGALRACRCCIDRLVGHLLILVQENKTARVSKVGWSQTTTDRDESPLPPTEPALYLFMTLTVCGKSNRSPRLCHLLSIYIEGPAAVLMHCVRNKPPGNRHALQTQAGNCNLTHKNTQRIKKAWCSPNNKSNRVSHQNCCNSQTQKQLCPVLYIYIHIHPFFLLCGRTVVSRLYTVSMTTEYWGDLCSTSLNVKFNQWKYFFFVRIKVSLVDVVTSWVRHHRVRTHTSETKRSSFIARPSSHTDHDSTKGAAHSVFT